MALSFPSSPALNDTYSVGSKTWKWNGSAWDLIPGGGVLTFGSSPPSSGNTIGDRWVDTTDGTQYTYFSDGDTIQWVDFSTPVLNIGSLIGGSTGSIPYQLAPSNTTFVSAGTNGQILSINSSTPGWVSQSSFSIANTQITGVMTASQLAATAVTPATYGGTSTMSRFTVDQQGRITSAANITPSIANRQITGVMTASQLAATAVTTGTYGGSSNIPVITVDQQGRLTYAANVAVSTGISITDDAATATALYPTFTSATSGSISGTSITSTKLTFVPSTGTLSATIVTATSDEKLKENISTIINAVNTVKQIRGVEYDWKDNGQHSMGVVAQELEKVLPYLVHEGENGKSVMYSNMIGLLIEAIKEQQIQIDDLKGMINGNN